MTELTELLDFWSSMAIRDEVESDKAVNHSFAS